MPDTGKVHDLVIVGGGPAGLTAGLYASRARLDAILVERGLPGGYLTMTDTIENYPGFAQPVAGMDLASAIEAQAGRFGLVHARDTVVKVEKDGDSFLILGEEAEYRARAVIAAAGSELGRIGVPGEAEFVGRGVSYCATCDGAFFRGREVAVIGGGDAAVGEAVFLTRFATKVHLIHRRDTLRATRVLQEEAFALPAIVPHWSRVVSAIEGDAEGVKRIVLREVKTGAEERLSVEGVFVFIGYTPRTGWLPPEVELDNQGFVVTDTEMRSTLPGIFAAGDIRSKMLRQVITAAGDGATAAFAAQTYLEGLARGQ
jgi:thioredoxin reductase (NADPH)